MGGEGVGLGAGGEEDTYASGVIFLRGLGERAGVLRVEEVGVGAVGEEGCYGEVVASCRGPVQGGAA